MVLVGAAVICSLAAVQTQGEQAVLAGPPTSISLDEPFTGSSLVDPSKWVASTGGTLLEWPCLTAASFAIIGLLSGTVEACVNQSGAVAAVGEGALRLTRQRALNDPNVVSGSPQYTDALGAAEGIDISFSIRSEEGSVADGLSFFLKDGANTSTDIGSAGGGLGYGMSHVIPALTEVNANGVPGALLGIGFDRYGNFSWSGVGSVDCGVDRGTHNSQGSPPSSAKNRIVLSGPDTSTQSPQDGSNGFCILETATVTYASGAFQRVRVKVEPYVPNSPTAVSVYLASAENPLILPITPTLTDTMIFSAPSFKFGFSAATGWWSNNHDVRDLVIRPAGPTISAIASDGASGSGTGPTSGGTLLTITGSNFDPAATVTVGGQPCTNVTVSGDGTQLTCETPAGSVGPAQVVVTNANGGPGYGTFTYLESSPNDGDSPRFDIDIDLDHYLRRVENELGQLPHTR
jgi:hypothetical protein